MRGVGLVDSAVTALSQLSQSLAYEHVTPETEEDI